MNTCEYTTLHLKFQHCTAFSMPKKWLITSLLGYYCNASEQRTSLQRLMPAVMHVLLFVDEGSFTNRAATRICFDFKQNYHQTCCRNENGLTGLISKKVFFKLLEINAFHLCAVRVCRQNHTTMQWLWLSVMIMLTCCCLMQINIKYCIKLRLVEMSL